MKKLTYDLFVEKAKNVHGNKYDYSVVKYERSNLKVDIICSEHGIFQQTPNNHLSRKSGCPSCGKHQQAQTNLLRYGFENPLQSDTIRKRIKQTNLVRYGAENPFGSQLIKESIRRFWIEKDGVEHVGQSNTIRKRIKQTNLARYGAESALKTLPIRNRIKQTMLDRYGVENSLTLYSVKQKRKQTLLDRYGIENGNQKHYTQNIRVSLTEKFLYEQYILNDKTTAQIAEIVGVNPTTICNYLRKYKIKIRHTKTHSFKAIQWLEQVMKEQNIFIQHAQNGGKYKIPNTRLKVDGFCEKTNTVYEFYGDLWHGNLDVYEPDKTFLYKTMQERYESTLQRETVIRQQGYDLITVWETNFEPKHC